MVECQYIRGMCDHHECRNWALGILSDTPEGPTVEEECAAQGHAYNGDDGAPPNGRGRCYCGTVFYPPGGPATSQHFAASEGHADDTDGHADLPPSAASDPENGKV